MSENPMSLAVLIATRLAQRGWRNVGYRLGRKSEANKRAVSSGRRSG
ncbi:hypothetical protein [Flavobacterium sp. W21_SRS_FM6]